MCGAFLFASPYYDPREAQKPFVDYALSCVDLIAAMVQSNGGSGDKELNMAVGFVLRDVHQKWTSTVGGLDLFGTCDIHAMRVAVLNR